MSDTTETLVWGEIDGQEITFPMEVRDFDAATFVFSVPAEAAQRLLPGDDFSVIEIVEGTAQLVVALCDYHDNPWGDYLEINLGFLARPTGAGEEVLGSFVYRMPVDQAFTCQAGNEVMGFPKTVEELSVSTSAAGSPSPWPSTVRPSSRSASPSRPRTARRRGSRPAATRTSMASPTRRRSRWTWARA
jgi:hypothetical protein